MKLTAKFVFCLAIVSLSAPVSGLEPLQLGGLTVAFVDLSEAKHVAAGRNMLASAAALTLKADAVRTLGDVKKGELKLSKEKYTKLVVTETKDVKSKEQALQLLRMQQGNTLSEDLAKTCGDFDVVVGKGALLYPASWIEANGKCIDASRALRDSAQYKATSLVRLKVGYLKGRVMERDFFERYSDTPAVGDEDATKSIVDSIHRMEAESSILCSLARGTNPCYAKSILAKIARIANSKGLDLVVDDTQVLAGIDALHIAGQDLTADVRK